MHPDVAALIEVQSDDLVIYDLEARLAALAPRLDELAREADRAATALAKARDAADVEERRQKDVHERQVQHRTLEGRNQKMLDSITSAREATAATAQLEQARRMITQDDQELAAIQARLDAARAVVAERERDVQRIEVEREEARQSLGAETRMLEEQLKQARADRTEKAKKVATPNLHKYDRIRAKRPGVAVYPLRGSSCAHCDTMIPLQRRSAMAGSGRLEICEGCGMLLYAAE